MLRIYLTSFELDMRMVQQQILINNCKYQRFIELSYLFLLNRWNQRQRVSKNKIYDSRKKAVQDTSQTSDLCRPRMIQSE